MPRAVAMTTGAFTISIDVELLWGVWDCAPKSVEGRCAPLERTITKRLLDLFREYEVRATWAVVSRLLDDARGFDGLRGDRECWYAPDIIDAIRSDATPHEIGSHSFSHVYFDTISRDEAIVELSRAKGVHERHGLPFTSFVFPRNGIGHLDALREAGVKVFRSTDEGIVRWASTHAPGLRPMLNLADKALALPPPVVTPNVRDDGLVELPSSMLLMARNGLRRVIHPRALGYKMREGVRRAARERALFHLWFHPSNFYEDMDSQLDLLEGALGEARLLRDAGALDVKTMGDFAELAN